jgi:hypothetical protein
MRGHSSAQARQRQRLWHPCQQALAIPATFPVNKQDAKTRLCTQVSNNADGIGLVQAFFQPTTVDMGSSPNRLLLCNDF